jgi:hypothetical protein
LSQYITVLSYLILEDHGISINFEEVLACTKPKGLYEEDSDQLGDELNQGQAESKILRDFRCGDDCSSEFSDILEKDDYEKGNEQSSIKFSLVIFG